MATISNDIQKLYQQIFGSSPTVPPASASPIERNPPQLGARINAVAPLTAKGRVLYEQYLGREVWLPVRLYAAFGTASQVLNLPYSVIRASNKKHIISTPLLERKGSVKELYATDDWSITVKGFLIGQNGQWPEGEIEQLNEFWNKQQSLVLENALTDILLEDMVRPQEQCRVVMESLELSEIEGGRWRTQAFVIKLLSDTVFTLEYNNS